MGNMKFKVGDRVRIKSLDWYNENKDEFNDFLCGEHYFTGSMKKLCSKIFEISNKTVDGYFMLEDKHKYVWTDEMIEGLVESVEDRMKELRKMCTISLTDSNYTDKIEVLLNDYEYIEENGKAYFVRKKKEYPKTYEDCCKVMNYCCNPVATKTTHKEELIRKFQFLLLYRDAYWKIAGEEMGLGKPWEPDWEENSEKSIITKFRNAVAKFNTKEQYTFAFPTEEMRDAFYENFKSEIESVKELL